TEPNEAGEVTEPAGAGEATEGAEPGAVDGGLGAAAGAGRGSRWLAFALVTMIVAALVTVGFLGARFLETRERERDRAEALHVARQLVVNFITLDYRTYDRDLKRVRALTA